MQTMAKNIIWIQEIRLRNTATLLAKEWLELVFHKRDINHTRWLPRDCVHAETDGECTISWLWENGQSQTFIVQTFSNTGYSFMKGEGPAQKQLYWKVNKEWKIRYTHLNDEQDNEYTHVTPFSRELRMSPVTEIPWTSEHILAIESIVSYTIQGKTRQIKLESLLGKIYE
jgi:hypothetical protein